MVTEKHQMKKHKQTNGYHCVGVSPDHPQCFHLTAFKYAIFWIVLGFSEPGQHQRSASSMRVNAAFKSTGKVTHAIAQVTTNPVQVH